MGFGVPSRAPRCVTQPSEVEVPCAAARRSVVVPAATVPTLATVPATLLPMMAMALPSPYNLTYEGLNRGISRALSRSALSA